jgi:large subunit ribosomal protein L4
MAEITKRKTDGTDGGVTVLDDVWFAAKVNVPLMHQVVTAQLAAARSGTQSTKTRSEVSGGGAKPFRQKGTGRSRQGTTRAPQWSGGGVAHAPKPRKYDQKTPKKMVRLALASALTDRANENKVVVLDGGFGFAEGKTKHARELLANLALEGSILIVVEREDETSIRAFRNLQEVQMVLRSELNAYDVLCNDWIVFTPDTLPTAAPATAETATTETAPPEATDTTDTGTTTEETAE